MSLIGLIVTLIVVGVLLWLVNNQIGQFIAPPMLKLINIVVVIVVILWLLTVFGLLSNINTIRVGPVG